MNGQEKQHKSIEEQLIGRKFRRNKYGLSLWVDEIREITPIYTLDKFLMSSEVKLIINRTYDLDEIVLI